LQLNRVENDAIVQFERSGVVAASAVVEDTDAGAQNRLAFVRSVGEGDARRKIVVVGEVGLPVVAKAEGELKLRSDLDLILKEGADLVGPVEAASDALLRGKDIGPVGDVVGERRESEGAEAVGVVVNGALAELRELSPKADVVLPMAPTDDFVDVDGVLGAIEITLRSASGECAVDLDGLCVGDAAGNILILLEGDKQLVDEVGRDDDAVVEDGVVFARVVVDARCGQNEAPDARVHVAVVLEVIAGLKAMRRGEIVRNPKRCL